MMRSITALAVVLLLTSLLTTGVTPLAAQAPGKKQAVAKAEPQLTLEAISRDPGKWAGAAPTQVRWAEDGAKLYFQWNPERPYRWSLEPH